MPERRGSKRVLAKLRVWCESEEFTLLSETGNVSSGGLFLRTSSTAPPTGPFRVTIDALGVVVAVEARWSLRGPGVIVPGMGVEIVVFERGAAAFRDYLDRLSTRSGEHRLSWPVVDGDGGGDESGSDGST